jgi:hypothetical protein
MTKDELRELSEVIKSVAHHNAHAWWQLKREIFDYGYSQYYPAASFFELPAKQVIERMPEAKKTKLLQLWRAARPKRLVLDDKEILASYARMVVEKVIERAAAAAYRTVEW